MTPEESKAVRESIEKRAWEIIDERTAEAGVELTPSERVIADLGIIAGMTALQEMGVLLLGEVTHG